MFILTRIKCPVYFCSFGKIFLSVFPFKIILITLYEEDKYFFWQSVRSKRKKRTLGS
ncbi:MAG: hypothetical protein MRERV_9c036 [Mycoplasmataceae bacterium RV_VA103A]|nr:MAG: hypothetical protein MRERV_9c036 [Mycoplasmataceae bacterium RV_VA103A]